MKTTRKEAQQAWKAEQAAGARAASPDKDKPPVKKLVVIDKVSELLNDLIYSAGHSFQFLKVSIRGADYYLSVSRYYPNKNIAIDLFYHAADYAAGNTEVKRKLLNENGIAYAFLAPNVERHNSVATLGDQLKGQP